MSYFALLRFFCKNHIHSCLGFVAFIDYFCDKIKKRTISDALPNLNLKTHERNKNTKIFHITTHNTEKVYIFA